MKTAIITRAAKPGRTQRAGKKPVVVLTDRDQDILVLVGLCLYLSSEQIGRDLFPSQDRCRKRLRALFDAGYLAVSLASSTVPNLVSLTSQGKAFITERQPEIAAGLRLPGPINLAGVAHRLLVVDLRLYLAQVAEKRQVKLTAWSNPGGDLHRQLGLERFGLQPDGVAELDTPAGTVRLALEADASTEDLSVLASKLARYRQVAQAEVLDGLWLSVQGGVRRQQAMAELVESLELDEWATVMDHRQTLVRPVIEPLARGAAGTSGRRP